MDNIQVNNARRDCRIGPEAKVPITSALVAGLRMALLASAVSLSLLPAGFAQQAPAAAPARITFEVASIKPTPSIATLMADHKMPSDMGTHFDAGRIDIGFASLQDLICQAYGVKPYQVSGPDWLTSERFDIIATLPAGATEDQVPQMLQALLADRFKLVLHRDSHALPVYALVVAKGGSRLQPAAPDADAPAGPPPQGARTIKTGNGTVTMSQSKTPGGGTTVTMSGGTTGRMQMAMVDGQIHLVADKMTMRDFANMLTPLLPHPVVDQTGLTGAYQISLAISQQDLLAVARAASAQMGMPLPPAAAGGGVNDTPAPTGSSIFASVQALGLRLDPRNAPVARIVIDHVEKQPTAN